MKVSIFKEEDYCYNELILPNYQAFRKGIQMLREYKDDSEAIECIKNEIEIILLASSMNGIPGTYCYVDPRDVLKPKGDQRIIVGTDEDEYKQVLKELGL